MRTKCKTILLVLLILAVILAVPWVLMLFTYYLEWVAEIVFPPHPWTDWGP